MKKIKKVCEIHGCELVRRFNSTFYFCPKCESEKRIMRNKRLLNKSKATGPKQRNFSIYKTTAWKWFSHYMLLKFADKNLMVRCATSGQPLLITSKKCHLGHYIKTTDMTKTNYSVAFSEFNVAPQSLKDNFFGGGRMDLMREYLVNLHGIEAIEFIERDKHRICILTKSDYKRIAEEYKEKFKQLLYKRGIADPWKK